MTETQQQYITLNHPSTHKGNQSIGWIRFPQFNHYALIPVVIIFWLTSLNTSLKKPLISMKFLVIMLHEKNKYKDWENAKIIPQSFTFFELTYLYLKGHKCMVIFLKNNFNLQCLFLMNYQTNISIGIFSVGQIKLQISYSITINFTIVELIGICQRFICSLLTISNSQKLYQSSIWMAAGGWRPAFLLFFFVSFFTSTSCTVHPMNSTLKHSYSVFSNEQQLKIFFFYCFSNKFLLFIFQQNKQYPKTQYISTIQSIVIAFLQSHMPNIFLQSPQLTNLNPFLVLAFMFFSPFKECWNGGWILGQLDLTKSIQ